MKLAKLEDKECCLSLSVDPYYGAITMERIAKSLQKAEFPTELRKPTAANGGSGGSEGQRER